MDRTRRPLIGLIVVVVLASVVAFAVLLREQTPSAEPPAPTVSPSPSRALVTAPLTGLPIPAGANLNHPAVAIKVSDVRQAHPHVGIDRADIVFVEPIGEAYTRLLAVFHSNLPDRVGPVRSMRPMDAPLLSPMAPVFGNTMGAAWVVEYVDEVANLDDLGTLRVSGSGAYVLDRDRPRPDHVFARPRSLLKLSDFTAPPRPYFPYAADLNSASAARSSAAGHTLKVPYGPGWSVTWTYDAATSRYLRSEPWGPHRAADGTRISATNVLALHVSSSIGKIGNASGAPVPILKLINGSGRFVALAGGRSVTGTWSKAGVDELFDLRSDDGTKLRLSPGNTWVELPSPSAKVEAR